ncbi:MAG: hypothetical protein H8E27_01770 [Verrucomicrobia subdivision 3 bacterium]|nr:hypothetical protein [Limisphaerales bacterium]
MVQAIDNIFTEAPLRGIRLAIGPAEALLPEESAGPTHEEQLTEQETAGHQRGRDEAAAEYEPQLAALRAELKAAKAEGANQQLTIIEETVQSQLTARLNELEAELIEFSTEAAIRLVHGLPISTGVIEAAIRETLEHCEQDAEVSVHLHPEDLKLLKAHQSELLQDSPHQRRVRYLEGTEVSRGGCLVETRCGVIDGRRETRESLLREAVSA